MKILFDNGAPKPIARSLPGHEVAFVRKIGWHELRNGELLDEAERAGFDVLFTTDKNIRYQQNLTGRRIAIVVLCNSQWPAVRLHLERVVAAIEGAETGSYQEVEIPRRK
jgi:predicted nuclease of predicted toxin-antitoxin system